MKKNVRILGLAAIGLAAVLIVRCSNTAPSGTFTLSGTVTNAVSGAPISAVVVAIQGKTVSTDATGHYSVANLTSGQSTLSAKLQGLDNYAQNVNLSGSTAMNIAMTPAFAAAVSGNWTGSWTNTTLASTGPATFVMVVDTVAQTAQLTIDFGGGVFGKGDPPAELLTGSYSPSTGLSVSKLSAFYGTMSLTVTAAGLVSGSMLNPPSTAISRVDFTGTATATAIALNFTTTFTGGTAVGTVSLHR